MEQDTKNLVDAIRLLQNARLYAAGINAAWEFCRHAETYLQNQLSALMRAAEEAA